MLQTTDRQTDRRQTDDRQTDGRTTTNSEHEHEFTFANNYTQTTSRLSENADYIPEKKQNSHCTTSGVFINGFSSDKAYCVHTF